MSRDLTNDSHMNGHIIICGLDSLGIRLVDELCRLGEDVVAVTDELPSGRMAAIAKTGVPIVQGEYRDPETLRRAGVETARAIALVEQDDVLNLHMGLAAQEINPLLRVVIRLFNESLRVAAEDLLHNCIALSASAIAAPLFVAAALDDDDGQRIEVGGRVLVVEEVDKEPPPGAVPLASPPRGDMTGLLPDEAEAGGLVLADAAPASSTFQPASSSLLRAPQGPLMEGFRSVSVALSTVADRRFRRLMAAILALVVVSVAVFVLFDGLSVIDAAYFVVTTITTTGYGDITVLHSSLGVKIYGIVLILAGATALALFYALVIDAFIGVRLARALGGVRRPMRNHMVVCGLGNVGSKVVADLIQRGIPVVAVEQDENAVNLAAARRLGVPVILGDASREESLRAARADKARGLITVTNDDVINLQVALNARNVAPTLRIVLRLFDHDLASRVDHLFSLSVSRSVSALAAPAFAAALLGRRVLAVIPVGRAVLTIAEIVIETGAPLDGATLALIQRPGAIHVLCVRTRTGAITWEPAMTSTLSPRDALICVASPDGVSHLEQQSRSASARQGGDSVR
jgi:Trk K+ transport system NAD-binding subunit